MRIIAKDCQFEEEDNMIRDKIVFSVYDKKAQECMLRQRKDAIDLCRAAELSQSELADSPKQEHSGVNDMISDGSKGT